MSAGALAGALAWAQAPPAQQPPPSQQQTPQRPPTFRGGAVLVTVDAYPQRDGRIVEGLTAADFEVFEDGALQAVENFEFVRVEPSRSESERRDPNTQQESLALAADPHNRVFVVFLDQLHVTVEGSHAIRKPLIDTLNHIVAPNDLFGVMTQNIEPRHLVLGRRLLSVEEQLTKYWPWGERYRLGNDNDDPMEDTLEGCFRTLPRRPYGDWIVYDNGQKRFLYEPLIDRRREDRTIASLERLVAFLAGLREARTVAIVVTDGWRLFREDRALAEQANVYGPTMPPVGVSRGGTLTIGDSRNVGVAPSVCQAELLRLVMMDNERRMRDLIEDANRANVSFYPVTPAGLSAFDTPLSVKFRPSLAEEGNRLRRRVDGLRTLAENTDGIAIVNTNDLTSGMRRVVEDVSAYYLLGYYSTNTTHDGKYRRIEVKMKPPGLRVRARRGYVAPSPERGPRTAAAASTRPAGFDDALAALARLRPAAELFTRAGIDGGELRVVVELAPSHAGAAPWNQGADVEVTVSGADGTSLPPYAARIEPGARGTLVSAPASGLAMPLRVAARITASGESLDDSTDVRASPPAVLGDAVLFRGRPAATAPLRPAADLRFYRTERLHAEWTIDAPLDRRTARLLGRNGSPLAVPVTLTERQRDGRTVLAADVTLAPLSGGEYVVEITVARGIVEEQTLLAFRVIQ